MPSFLDKLLRPAKKSITDFFEPTENVRPRDVVREAGGVVSDVSNFLFPKRESIIEDIQQERQQTLLPEFAKKKARERELEMGLLRAENPDSKIGEGPLVDPLGAVGAMRNVGKRAVSKTVKEVKPLNIIKKGGRKIYKGFFEAEPAQSLPPAKRAVEINAVEQLEKSPKANIARYKNIFGKELNTDSAREIFPDYAPGGPNAIDDITRSARAKNSAAVHEAASSLIKKIYNIDLKAKKGAGNNKVIFTSGGAGSGKSSAIKNIANVNQKVKDSPIIYDTNLAKFNSATSKIDDALKHGYDVEIVYVHRNPLDSFVSGSLPRAQKMGRTVPLEDHIKTHTGAIDTIKKINKKYAGNKKVNIIAIDNTRGKDQAQLVPIDALKKVRYNEDVLRQHLSNALENEYNKRTISKNVYEGTKEGLRQGLRGTFRTGSGRKPQSQRSIRVRTSEAGTGTQKQASLAKQSRQPTQSQRARPSGFSSAEKNKVNQAIEKIKKDGTVKQVFRKDKLNLPEEQTNEISKRLEALGLGRRKVKTFEDMERAAQELGVDPRKLLQETTRRLTDEDVIALRNLINNNTNFILKAEKEILENPAREAEILPRIRVANQQIDVALKKLVQGGTELGRGVASFRIMANKTLDPTFWFQKAQRELGSKPLTPEMRQAIIDLIDQSDRLGLANFISMLRDTSAAEKGITLWKAGLLTSPTTHAANIQGNITMSALMSLSDIPSTALDVMISFVTGKRTTTISPAVIVGKIKGAKTGIRKAATYAKTGLYDEELLTKYDIPKKVIFTGNKTRWLNVYTEAIFRSLGAEDIVFRQAAMQESLEKHARVIAKNEGYKGKEFIKRVRELLINPTNEMSTQAIDAAEYATFQSKNALADLIQGGKARIAGKQSTPGSKAVLTSAELLAPFTRTPTNIAARIADFSPLGFFKVMFKMARPETRTQKAFVEDMGRAITGTSVIVGGSYLASKGLMTGNAPSSAKERAQFYAEGKQANAIKIGGNWYQLNKISPVGNLLALGAEFNDLSKEKEGIDLAVSTAFGGAKGLTEMTFLRGVSGGLKAINEPERHATRFIHRSSSSLVPSLIGRTARTIDPTLRVSDSILEAVATRIPFATKVVAPRRDIFGEAVRSPGGRAALIDPFNTKKAVDDPVIREAKKVGVTIGMPSKVQYGTTLNEHEYSIYQEINGKTLKKVLSQIIQSEGYQKESSTEKEKIIDATIREVRSRVKEKLFPALMIERYSLPRDTNPEVLIELMNRLNDKEEFKKKDEEEKGRIIQRVLNTIQTGSE